MNQTISATAALAYLAFGVSVVAATAARAQTNQAEEVRMKTLTIEGAQGKLATIETGEGEGLPVLFLHADLSRASQWQDILGRTGKERRVVAFDARGHGDSDPAKNGDYSYTGRAEDIASVAEVLGLKRFVIVAHSGGAGGALLYAVDNPDRVAGLFLLDPATDPRQLPEEIRASYVRDLAGPKSLQAVQAYYRSIGGSNPATVGRVLADTEVTAPAARAGVGKALAEWNPELTLNAWRGPIFILATKIGDTPAALFRLKPDIPHRVLDTNGHWPQLDQPEVVEAAVREFVAGVEQEKN